MQLLMTRGINDTIAENEDFAIFIMDALSKYHQHNWGDTCKEDKQLNDSGDDRIVAKYNNNKYGDIFIITEYDRSATTILFTHEY